MDFAFEADFLFVLLGGLSAGGGGPGGAWERERREGGAERHTLYGEYHFARRVLPL